MTSPWPLGFVVIVIVTPELLRVLDHLLRRLHGRSVAAASFWRRLAQIASIPPPEMTAIADEVQLLTPAQAAAALAVSRRQLDRLVDAGVLTPVRLTPGGNRRFRVADLAALVNETNEEENEDA